MNNNNNQATVSIPPFVLYGLVGCPHCAEAEAYLKKVGVPFSIFIANLDPIAEEGIKKLTGKEEATYPVLLYKVTKEIVVEYKPEEYERLSKSFYALAGASTPSVFSGEQPNISQSAQQTTPA